METGWVVGKWTWLMDEHTWTLSLRLDKYWHQRNRASCPVSLNCRGAERWRKSLLGWSTTYRDERSIAHRDEVNRQWRFSRVLSPGDECVKGIKGKCVIICSSWLCLDEKNKGVPLRSMLGPLLFAIYVNCLLALNYYTFW